MPLCKLPRGLTVGYDDIGSGTPLVLLHAFPLDRGMWKPQLTGLTEVARLIALDFPGFGESSPTTFTIDDVADVVAEFLAALEIPKAVVCGLSMGGYVALALARRHSNLLRGLIFCDTRAGVDDSKAKAGRDQAITTVKEHGATALFEGMLPKVLSDATRSEKPEVVESIKSLATRQPVPSLAAALAALRDRPDANDGLAAIAAPTLVLVGEFDAVTPPLSAANLAAQIRNSALVYIPDAGHLSNLENPDAFNAAVRKFLKGLK